MADNPFDLTSILSNAQQIQAAGAGGYGDQTSALRKAMMFMGVIAPALAGIRQKGLIPAGMEAAGNYARLKNLQDYNRYTMAGEALKQQEALKKIDETGRAYGTADSRLSGMGRVDSAVMKNIMDALGNRDFGDAALKYQQGGYPESFGMAPASQVSDLTQKALEREGQISDSAATIGQLLPMLQRGQNASRIGNRALAGGLEADPRVEGPAPGVLAGGVSQDTVNVPTVNPWMRGAMQIDPLVDMITQGLKDSQEMGSQNLTAQQQAEASRHNRAAEAAQMKNANASMLRAQKYQPGGGGGGQVTDAAAANDLYRQGLLSLDDYAARLSPGRPRQSAKPPKTLTAKDAAAAQELMKHISYTGWGAKSPQEKAQMQAVLDAMGIKWGGGTGNTSQQPSVQIMDASSWKRSRSK